MQPEWTVVAAGASGGQQNGSHGSQTAAHGGRDLRVFGSVIHGAAGLQSDVDLLVDFPSSPSFEQYMDLKLALEDLLSARVDLVTRRGLRPELRQRIEQEAIPLA